MNYIKKLLKILAQFILRFPISVFLFSCVLAIISVFFIKKIELDPSLNGLLPKEHSVFKLLEEANQVFGHRDIVIVFVRSDSIKAGENFIKTASAELKEYKEIKEVYYELPDEFFRKNFLLYLDQADLNTLYTRLKKKIDYEKEKSRIGLLFDDLVEEEEDPGFEYQDIIDKYKERKNFEFDNSLTNFFYKKKEGDEKGNHVFIIMVKPKQAALDLAYSAGLISKISKMMEQHRQKFPEIRSVEYTGRYQKKPESIQALIKNFRYVTVIAITGVLLILIVFFRSAWPVLLISIGLFYGILLSLGITQIFIGSLNLISTFLVAILLGLGIDFGIHIMLRYKEERDAGRSVDEAFILMYTETCSASLIAAFTTSVAFGTLIFSNFVGFSDFGFIGCVGILSILFSYMTLTSSLILILTRHFNVKIISSPMRIYLPGKIWEKPKILIGIGFLFTCISLAAVFNLKFNYDFSRLLGGKELPSYKLNKEVNDLFGRSFDVPFLILADNLEQEKKILSYIKEKSGQAENSKFISLSLGLSSFVPEAQEQKLPVIRKMKNLIDQNQKHFDQMSNEYGKPLLRFKKQLRPALFTSKELPAYIKNNFTTEDPNKTQRMILAYTDINTEDGREVIKFADYISHLEVGSKPVRVASDSLIFSEILNLIQNEGGKIGIFAILAIFFMIAINLRSISKGLLVIFPVLLGLFWMLGIQSLMGLKSDFINVISYIVVLGTGIDGAIHLYQRFKESNDLFIATRNTGEAISLSSITTMIGFGALTFGDNESVAGLGFLALLGIVTNYVACMFILPAILRLKLKN